jgi:L-aminopeptidase/D-esterase-like protein
MAFYLHTVIYLIVVVGIVHAESKPRARDLGIPFDGAPGPLNAITDVTGVTVGHTTLISGQGKLKVGFGPVRTGVTAVLPRGNDSADPVFAGWFSQNGNGEMTGTTWVEESGFLEGPVLTTNTSSVGVVRDAVVKYEELSATSAPEKESGSVIVVVATDAPLLPHQIKRLARRVSMGLARTGSTAGNGSGDIFIAFSTANSKAAQSGGLAALTMLPNDCMDPLFEAVVQATEESVINALIAGETMVGRDDNKVLGLPHDRVREILKKHNRLVERK